MSKKILVVDIGTQSLRASIVDSDKGIVHHVQKKYEPPYFSVKKDYAEQEPNFYLETLSKATKELKEQDAESFSSLSSMVVVAFRDTSVILDADKKPIRPAILWLDQRTAKLKNLYNLKWYEKVLFRLLGMHDTVKYNSMRTPSFWIMENEPENWKRMRYYVPLTAYFNYRMTDNLAVSSADCIGHYPVNFKKGIWFPSWHPKVNVFGIPMESLPPLVKPGETIGKVTAEFSRHSGIPEGLPLLASGSDKSCETFGNGAIDPSVASISLGTACSIDVVSEKYKEPEMFLPSYGTPYPGAFDYEIQVYRGLWMLRWFSEQFGETDLLEAKREGLPVETFLDRKIASILPGSDGLVLQPYWGPGLKRPNARGSIIGFSGAHTRFHLYRAIIEGIGFALREGLDEIVRKTHRMPDHIVVSGGGSRSSLYMQILADIFGLEVRQAENPEMTTIGAAMSAFLAEGVFKTPKEATERFSKTGSIVRPIPKNHEIYDLLYKKVYRHIYPSLKDVYKNCKDFYLLVNKE